MKLSSEYQEALEPVILAIADDELIMGHRHSEWTGWAPHIEEDIAFSSIAQDEIGHAALLYGMLEEVGVDDRDKLALGREQSQYLNAIICERPNNDWAFTLARHFLYEAAERIRLTSLSRSSFTPLADAAEKLLREERYHQLHADAWFRRIASGPVEGRHQFAVALSQWLPEATALFEAYSSEGKALEQGILSQSSEELMGLWLSDVVGRIEEAGFPLDLSPEDDTNFVPTASGELLENPTTPTMLGPKISRDDGRWLVEGNFPARGGRFGRHSDDFGALWEDLTMTYREEPTATW